jgi:hypothetical protein
MNEICGIAESILTAEIECKKFLTDFSREAEDETRKKSGG